MAAPTPTHRRTVTRDEVVDAARDILDEQGLDGLTMANVAARVGFTTMAVYRHVKNREDLIAGAVAIVLGEIAAGGDDPALDWLDGVEAWMHDVRTALLTHPWAVTKLGTRQGGSSVPWMNTLQILSHHIARGPLSPPTQARALAWTTRITVGVLMIELAAPMREMNRRRNRTDVLGTLTDDDLWADTVHQTRHFLTELAATEVQRKCQEMPSGNRAAK